jgi:acyl-CoA reductase-like NAD-dependent aldehyde dehydrogenase
MIPVRDPRTGVIDHHIAPATHHEIATLSARARAAQTAWSAQSLDQRAATLLAFCAALEARSDAIAAALERDTGRRAIARMEVGGVMASLSAWAAQALSLLPSGWTPGRAMPNLRHAPQFVPYGLVGVISAWNFPLTLSMIDTIPALLAGAAVIVKPSEVTPRFVAPFADAILAIPDLRDVLAFILGDGASGQALIEQVDAVCFTGSVATGRKVAVQAATRLIPAFLELGGKDPLLILESANLDHAVTAALRGSVLSTGQACQSIERIYVARGLYDAFVSRLVDAARVVRFNWPDITTGELGPIIFANQAETLQRHMDDARAKGARILTGGVIERHGGGLWLAPTVIVDVTHEMAVMREETFGPILPVMAFDTVEDAIALANDTDFGLSAAVMAATLDEAESVARRLDAGAVSLNDAALTALFHEAEKHAFKASGLGGSRMGQSGFHRFFRRKALIANTAAPRALSTFAEDAGA